jgi:hypothetical protein
VVDRGARRRLEERRAIEAALQDGLHGLEARAADRDCARARGVDALAAVAIGEPDDAEARPVTGLGVRRDHARSLWGTAPFGIAPPILRKWHGPLFVVENPVAAESTPVTVISASENLSRRRVTRLRSSLPTTRSNGYGPPPVGAG